ncbi:Alanine--glyoxylate aminotransferase 2, mitochondrial [Geodia barretti]|uniref:Alanine--glyoxylate aminotransferase 2, mitochondrial n=1 Tax=Geodia barretti TaxID=519541 RepID=A0AA35RBR0_GEOBA|nr:Alanine--glyoxylate aminotransferase 2, mitochondrial [Geodia barretti]
MTKALHFNTYGGNPMACAVGSAVLDAIEEDGLQANSRRVGEVLLKEMMTLRDEFEIVGDVRGKGLMLGMEMVQNKGTKEPLAVDQMNAIWETCKEDGVLLGKGGLYGSVFRIKPPMCITEADAQFGIDVMRSALKKHSM